MSWYKNLKVKAKMIVSFMGVIVLMAVLSVVSFFQLQKIENDFRYVLDHPTRDEMTMQAFISTARDMRRMVATMGMFAPTNDSNRIDALYKDAMAAFEEGMGLLDTLEENVKSDYQVTDADLVEARETIGSLRAVFQRYKDEFCDPVADAARRGDHAATLEYAAVASSIADDLRVQAGVLIGICHEMSEEALAESEAAVDQTQIMIISISIFALIIALVIALYMASLISKPLIKLSGFMKHAGATGDITLSPEQMAEIGEFAKAKDEIGETIGATASFVKHVTNISQELDTVASGDLTTEIELLSDKDIMGKALIHMVDSLNTLFGEINHSTAQVSSGSKQIADGAQSLAQGSTEQASSIEQLSASMTEIAQKTKDNAEKAGKAAVLANTIKQNAEKGSRQMNEMTSAVKEINTASQSIQKVIKVIDDIAFQTNILALNAAVEAARAGQHGKGFAVVAEEVRNLASKSADAAKETGAMIENSMEKAELGSRIAGETAASLVEIVQGINESSQIITEIAQSSDEQSAGIAQINAGIDQVASVVQQNSATAEESAAASEEMSGQSATLEDLVAQFKLKDEDKGRGLRSPKKQLSMPDKTSYSPNGGGDFGKY